MVVWGGGDELGWVGIFFFFSSSLFLGPFFGLQEDGERERGRDELTEVFFFFSLVFSALSNYNRLDAS